jgi:hypothetical protein
VRSAADQAAAEVAAVADQTVLRKDADPMDRREVAGTTGHRPTSVVVDLADLTDGVDRRLTSVPAALEDPTSVPAALEDPTSTAVDPVISEVGPEGPISTAVDPATSMAVDPAITTGVRRGIPVTTTGMGAGMVRLGVTMPRPGAGVRRRRRCGTDRCHLRGGRPRRRSTIGASRSSQSGIRATTSGASTSSGSGFHFRSDPGS